MKNGFLNLSVVGFVVIVLYLMYSIFNKPARIDTPQERDDRIISSATLVCSMQAEIKSHLENVKSCIANKGDPSDCISVSAKTSTLKFTQENRISTGEKEAYRDALLNSELYLSTGKKYEAPCKKELINIDRVDAKL